MSPVVSRVGSVAVDVDADEPAGHSDRLANTQSASLARIATGGGATQAVGLTSAQSVLAAETSVWLD